LESDCLLEQFERMLWISGSDARVKEKNQEVFQDEKVGVDMIDCVSSKT